MSAVLTDPQAQRQAIFDLRAAGVPFREIASQLGISLGKVQRELKKRAARADGSADGLGEGAAQASRVDAAALNGSGRDYSAELDPVILERQRAIQLRRLNLQESALELQALEQQQRLDVLRRAAAGAQGGGGGESAQLVLMLMQQMDALRAELRNGSTAATAAVPTRSLIDQLSDLQKLGTTIATFAPPSAPSGPADLDYKIALRKLDLEDQRILRKDEAELKIRAAEAASVQARNDALAGFIQQFGPTIGQVINKYVDDHAKPSPSYPPAPGEDAPALPAGEVVKGNCPQCGQILEMSGSSAEKCPACGFMVVVSGGQIVAAPTDPTGGNGAGPRPRVVRAAETFAS